VEDMKLEKGIFMGKMEGGGGKRRDKEDIYTESRFLLDLGQ